jgi:methyl-accepting chemotaxis protein
MNAEIESAHAGEAGRGFAVVAEEIRKLAESTSENSARIGNSLQEVAQQVHGTLQAGRISSQNYEQIINDVKDFVDALNQISENTSQLATGTKEVMHATDSVSDITVRVKERYAEVEELAGRIAGTMESVKTLTNGVTGGVTDIDTGTREILNAVEVVDRMSHQSSTELGELQELVQTFRTVDGRHDEE